MKTDIYETEERADMTEDLKNKAGHVYEQTRESVSQAYDRTAGALSETYDQAMMYARENPGKTTLIAVGIGVAVGLLLASGRRSRIRRFGEPIVNALSDVAMEIVRGF